MVEGATSKPNSSGLFSARKAPRESRGPMWELPLEWVIDQEKGQGSAVSFPAQMGVETVVITEGISSETHCLNQGATRDHRITTGKCSKPEAEGKSETPDHPLYSQGPLRPRVGEWVCPADRFIGLFNQSISDCICSMYV